MIPVRHSILVGAAARSRQRAHASTINPDSANRNPAMSSGGSVSTANRIARYVDPHTR
jgi:hypothetical protein